MFGQLIIWGLEKTGWGGKLVGLRIETTNW